MTAFTRLEEVVIVGNTARFDDGEVVRVIQRKDGMVEVSSVNYGFEVGDGEWIDDDQILPLDMFGTDYEDSYMDAWDRHVEDCDPR